MTKAHEKIWCAALATGNKALWAATLGWADFETYYIYTMGVE